MSRFFRVLDNTHRCEKIVSVLGSTFQYDPFQLIIYQLLFIAVTSALIRLLGSDKDEPMTANISSEIVMCACAVCSHINPFRVNYVKFGCRIGKLDNTIAYLLL